MSTVHPKPKKPTDTPDAPPPSLTKFLHKTLVVVIVIILVPLFPTRAPDFINQSLFTRSWELVHLLFVGIAVCYGLFSRRNDDVELQKEGVDGSFETSVSRFLQASSSVFDDQLETLDAENDDEETRNRNSSSYGNGSSVQSWSSQYSRNEPVVVVAADETSGSVSGEQSRGIVNRSMRTRVLSLNDKPLLLPVRSLKSTRVLDSGTVDGSPRLGRSKSIRGSNEVADSNVVLRSPIPWRSRSGRFEMKEETEGFNAPVNPSIDLSNRASVYTHSVSPELVSKELDDGSRRKGLHKPSPPPAPPLPPPKYYKPEIPSMYSDTRLGMSSNREFIRDATRVESGRSVREEMMRRLTQRNSASNFDNATIPGKSVRTGRPGESISMPKTSKESGTESYWKDVMEAPNETTRSERKLSGSNRHDKTDQLMNTMEVSPRNEAKVVPEDIVTVESDSETEDEDEVSDTLSSLKRSEPQSVDQPVPDFGPDVDKKADEFIAKFREQIRLQRIESIKRSTNQATRKVT